MNKIYKIIITSLLLATPFISHASLGDILYGSANPSINSRLSIGASSTCLTTNGTIPAWGTNCGSGISTTYATSTDSASVSSISAWGDSLTYGAGVSAPGKEYIYILPSYLNFPIINVSKNGYSGQGSLTIANAFLAATSSYNRHEFVVIWSGNNDATNQGASSTIPANINAMIAQMKTPANYLVLGMDINSANTIGTANYIAVQSVNTVLAATYTGHYYDERADLMSTCNAPGVTNTTGWYASTTQDITDCGNDVTPTSLRIDAIHINDYGNLIVAKGIAKYINANVGVGTKAVNYSDIGYLAPQATDVFSAPTLQNFFVGTLSRINQGATGIQNTGVGLQALGSLTTGIYNSALGRFALQQNTTGTNNTAMGTNAGYGNITSGYNTAIGSNSLYGTMGSFNTAVGALSGATITSGGYNNCFGVNCMGGGAVTGNYNIADGQDSLFRLTSGTSNVCIGLWCGFGDVTNGTTDVNTLTTGNNNTWIGNGIYFATSSQFNSTFALGYRARPGCSNCGVLGGTGADAVKVGIGTTTPGTALSVIGTTTTSGLVIANLPNVLLGTDVNGNVVATTSSGTGTNYFTTSGATTTLSTGSVLQANTASTSNLCLGGTCNTSWPSGTLSGGTTNALTYWTSATTVGATSTPVVNAIISTSATATSTFAGSVQGKAGTASQPSRSFTNDTQTGIFSKAAGSLGISGYGGSADTTPGTDLFSFKTVVGEPVLQADTNSYGPAMRFYTSDGLNALRMLSANTQPWIDNVSSSYFQQGVANGNAMLTALSGTAFNRYGVQALSFQIQNYSAANAVPVPSGIFEVDNTVTPVFVVKGVGTTAGNIGIGSSSPSSRLSIQGTSTYPTANLFNISSSTGATLFNVDPSGNATMNGSITSSGTATSTFTGSVQAADFNVSSKGSLISSTTAGTVLTYTTPAQDAMYKIDTYYLLSANLTDTIQGHVSYTDIGNNTFTFSSSILSGSPNAAVISVALPVKGGTAINVTVSFPTGGGSATYSSWATITKISNM